MKKILALSLVLFSIVSMSFKPSTSIIKYDGLDSIVPVNNNYGTTTNLVAPTFGNIVDTLSNSTTHYLIYPLTRYNGIYPRGYYKTDVITLNDSTISGTLALTASLQRSSDDYNWYTLKSDTIYTISATGTYKWYFPDNPDAFYRIKVVGGNTQSTQLYGDLLYRKPVNVNN